MTADQMSIAAARERALRKLGGACGVVGALGFLAAGSLHGDLPSETADAVRYLAGRPYWSAVHLGAIVSTLLWLPAFAALAHSLRSATGWVLGRLALTSLTVGVAVFIVDYSIDGYALKVIADDWAAVDGAARAAKLVAADAVLGVLRGTVLSSLTWLFGLPFLVMGLALSREAGHLRRLGWTAAVTGAGTAFAGMAQYAGVVPERLSDPVFVAGILFSFGSAVWLVVIGVLLWRRP
jgi:hypothetical protein